MAKLVKKAAAFVICFIMAFKLARYGMPLYPLTVWLVAHSLQTFGHCQADIYEADADPVTFFSLLAGNLASALGNFVQ